MTCIPWDGLGSCCSGKRWSNSLLLRHCPPTKNPQREGGRAAGVQCMPSIPAAGNHVPCFHHPSCKAKLEALPHVLVVALQPRASGPPAVFHFHRAHSGTSAAIPAAKGHDRGVGIKTLVKWPFGKPGLHLIRCRQLGLPEQQVNQLMAAMSWTLLSRPGGSPRRAARGIRSFPPRPGRTAAPIRALLPGGWGGPSPLAAPLGLPHSPCTQRKAGGCGGADAGFNGLQTNGGRMEGV